MEKNKKRLDTAKIKVLKKILPGNSPDFIIVGAQKAGTTSLHYYLKQHPKIAGSIPKEVNFFGKDSNYSKGYSWYKKAFINYHNPFKKTLFFEATPSYLYRRNAAKRIYKFSPSTKIIILLREPVKRAYSSWNMYRDFPIKFSGKLPKSLDFESGNINVNNLRQELYEQSTFPAFEECIESEMKKIKINSELEEPSFIRRGIYLPQIKRYHELFGKEQVMVIGFRDFIENKIETLNDILVFLGLDKSNWTFLNDEKKNVRKYPEKLDPEIEKRLTDFYKPHNRALFDYLKTEINW